MIKLIGLLLTASTGCWLWKSNANDDNHLSDVNISSPPLPRPDAEKQYLSLLLRSGNHHDQSSAVASSFAAVSTNHNDRLLPLWEDLLETYQQDPSRGFTYDDYLRAIPDKLILSERDYQMRKAIWEENWDTIQQHNLAAAANESLYRMGLNEFMDLYEHELPQRGYDKAQSKAWNLNPIDTSTVTTSDAVKPQKETTDDNMLHSSSNLDKRRELDYWTTIDVQLEATLDNLPKMVDWRVDATTGKPLATPVKVQGRCGSCWAFATAAAMESHVAIASPNQTLLELSEQELVSCVPNPNHCGGAGGCHGSTAELALNFIAHRGIVDEWHFGYQSFNGDDNSGGGGGGPDDHRRRQHHRIKCSLKLKPFETENDQHVSKYYQDVVAAAHGYVKLPANNYTALMHTVATFGPVIVNVAAQGWRSYESGVYAPTGHSSKQTDIDHVVLLMGYGTDDVTGEDYWLVRNSWGTQWGEEGYIRLKRTDPISLPRPDADCGMDVTPANGIACTEGDDGNGHQHHITPPAVKVCGTSGILFDPVLPYGVHLVK